MHPNQRRGQPGNAGKFATMERNAGTADLGPAGDRCPACGRFTTRGGRPAHRCPHPGLVEISPELEQLLGMLEDIGARPYLVGGSVRDALLGAPSDDIDIECFGVPLADIEAALRDRGIAVDTVGASFVVCKAKIGDVDFDLSSPRRDSKTGDRHRDVDVVADHTLDEVDASSRRDFTVNALMWDPRTGDLIDAHGGLADLDAGVLRHVSDAFGDDPVRPLRGVRFAGRLGFTVDPETADVCRALADQHQHISASRIWKEWHKIAATDRPGTSLEALRQIGWDANYPQLAAVTGVPQDPAWHPEGTVEVHIGQVADAAAAIAKRDGLSDDDRDVLVFAAITHGFGKATHTTIDTDGRVRSKGHDAAGVAPAEAFLTTLGARRETTSAVAALVAEHQKASSADAPTPRAVRRLARRLAPHTTIEMWGRMVEADYAGRGSGSGPGPQGPWVEMAARLDVGAAPRPRILAGRDLIAAGLKPGPRFSTILDAAEQAQDDGAFDDAAGATAWLAELLASEPTA